MSDADRTAILAALQQRPGLSRRHLATLIGRPDLVIDGALSALLLDGTVLKQGRGKGSSYYLAGAPVHPVRP